MTQSTDAENAAMLGRLDLAEDSSILEIGIGNGRTLHRIAEQVITGRIAAIDISAKSLRLAAKLNQQSIQAGRIELKHGQSDAIPFEDHHFDIVFSAHTVYFWNDPQRDLSEIRRVLKPGGTLALIFASIDDGATTKQYPVSHFKLYTRDDFAALVRKHGFDVETGSDRFGQRHVSWIIGRAVQVHSES